MYTLRAVLHVGKISESFYYSSPNYKENESYDDSPHASAAHRPVSFRVWLEQGLSSSSERFAGVVLARFCLLGFSGCRFHTAVVDPGWDSFYLYSHGGGQDDGLRSFPPWPQRGYVSVLDPHEITKFQMSRLQVPVLSQCSATVLILHGGLPCAALVKRSTRAITYPGALSGSAWLKLTGVPRRDAPQGKLKPPKGLPQPSINRLTSASGNQEM